MNTTGRSLELFFIDGRPDGMLTAEVFNWTGHVLRLPRTQIKKGLSRPATGSTGVYILIGENDEGPLAYIGEAEDMRRRLKEHVSGKEWWDTAILVSTTGDLLHKAHVKYLESRLVELARSAGSMSLENGNTPPRSSLTEAAQANMESFLDTLQMVLPAIRVDMFLDKSRPSTPLEYEFSDNSRIRDSVTFTLETPKHGISGKAVLLDGEWIVKAGSQARAEWAGSRHKNTHYFKLHDELLANGTLEVIGNHAFFTKDFAFSSPSAAAAILNGRSSNGRKSWKEENTGKTFAAWEDDLVSSVEEIQ
jgi:Domain of unknown function (DUF4357)